MEDVTHVQEHQSNFDWISSLPDPLLCQILSYLSTKESLSTSVLSKRWRYLWLQVPVLDLNYKQFEYLEEYRDVVFINFLDRFLGLDNDQHLEKFSLIYAIYNHDDSLFKSWIDAVIKRRVCHLYVVNDNLLVRMPISIYSSETLVYLHLVNVVLVYPEYVLLPCVKIMYLGWVEYDDDSTLEILILSCPVLEELTITRDRTDHLEDMYIRSESLKSFKIECYDFEGSGYRVEIDAPRLEYMSLMDHASKSYIIHCIGPSTRVYIDVVFDLRDNFRDFDPSDASQITMFNNFLTGLSTISDLTISYDTLKIFLGYCKIATLPQFSNLSRLDIHFLKTSWEIFSSFFESFPNLRSLLLKYDKCPHIDENIDFSFGSVPQCFLSSLEFVHLEATFTENKIDIAKYILENCVVLKKLTLCKSFCNIIKEIKSILRRSTICEVVME